MASTHLEAQIGKNTDNFLDPVDGFGHSWVSNMAGGTTFLPSDYLGINFIDLMDTYLALGGQLRASSEGYNLYYYSRQQKVRPEYLRLPLRAYYFFGDYFLWSVLWLYYKEFTNALHDCVDSDNHDVDVSISMLFNIR